jgi:hypothetical protein
LNGYNAAIHNRAPETYCENLADRITAVSDEDKNLFSSKYGRDTEKAVVIPSGCELCNPLHQ